MRIGRISLSVAMSVALFASAGWAQSEWKLTPDPAPAAAPAKTNPNIAIAVRSNVSVIVPQGHSPYAIVGLSSGATGPGKVAVIDLRTMERFGELLPNMDRTFLALSPDGKHIAQLDQRGPLQIWSVVDGKKLHQIDVPTELRVFRYMEFTGNGKLVTCIVGDKPPNCDVQVWNVATGNRESSFETPMFDFRRGAFTQGGRYLLTLQPSIMSAYDLTTGREVGKIKLNAQKIPIGVACSPEGKEFAVLTSAQGDMEILRYELSTGANLGKITFTLSQSEMAKIQRRTHPFMTMFRYAPQGQGWLVGNALWISPDQGKRIWQPVDLDQDNFRPTMRSIPAANLVMTLRGDRHRTLGVQAVTGKEVAAVAPPANSSNAATGSPIKPTSPAASPAADLSSEAAAPYFPKGDAFALLINNESGQALAVWSASKQDGAQAALWKKNVRTDKQWKFTPVEDGWGTLTNSNSGTLLTAKKNSQGDWYDVIIESPQAGDNRLQQWKLVGDENDWFTIENRQTGLVIGPHTDEVRRQFLRLWSRKSHSNSQQFTWESVASVMQGASTHPRELTGLCLEWRPPFLTITGDFPGGKIDMHYVEAYCQSGSSKQNWEDTTIRRGVSRPTKAASSKQLWMRDTLENGVIVDHSIRAETDSVVFTVDASNPTKQSVDVQWSTACVRVRTFTQADYKDGKLSIPPYARKCFIFLEGQLARMPIEPWATEARYKPGQVFRSPNVDLEDLNPRPLNESIPSNGLVGCFSADEKHIVAMAWQPFHQVAQNIHTCIHSDLHIGGLKPGESKQIRGRLYIVDADVNNLLARYERDLAP